jgi:hypothetical protein
MNLTPQNQIKFLPTKTLTTYSAKKNAWLLQDVLKSTHQKPTFKALYECCINARGIQGFLSPICPYKLPGYFLDKALAFFQNNEVDMSSQLKHSNILRFLAICDGYLSWENMTYHLKESSINYATFSIKLSDDKKHIDVYVYYEDETHPLHGKKLNNKPLVITLPNLKHMILAYTNPHEFQDLIYKLLCLVFPDVKNNEAPYIMEVVKFIHSELKTIEQIHPEVFITELDLRQMMEYKQTITKQQMDAQCEFESDPDYQAWLNDEDC